MTRPEAFVAAARHCVGTRFRLQGRIPGLGLDCAGVILFAAKTVGVHLKAPEDYTLQGEDFSRRTDALLSGQLCADSMYRIGNILVYEPAPCQRHLAIWSGTSMIHAHAGVRCVVETSLNPSWTLLNIWKLPKE